jgi:hypothetical protein
MKKNLLKIPNQILGRINAFELDDIVVACAKRLSVNDVPRYAHLGISIRDGNLDLPEPRVPNVRAGRFSKANIDGRDVIRRDLPMVEKTYSWESPNWGDWSQGSHTHHQTRDVYRRDFIPPKEVELSVTLLEKISDEEYVLKFAVDQVLNKKAADFEADLLYNLNILQENVGAVDVFPSAATLAEYMKTVRVDWEILPPGKVDEIVKRMLVGKRPVSDDKKKQMEQRLGVMAKLQPTAFIAGTNGFLRYFGAMFGDDLVAFENLMYGNALYVMYEDWKSLSQRSRVDLLKGPRDGFDRIEHREGWDDRLRTLVRDHKKEKGELKTGPLI